MKIIIVLVLSLLTTLASATENVEIAVDSWWVQDNENVDYNALCMKRVYDLETKVLDKVNDTSVQVRKSRVSNDIGMPYVTCYAKFFSSERTSFAKEALTYNLKKCNGQAEQLQREPSVVWIQIQNRVKLPNGIKGCKAYIVRASKV